MKEILYCELWITHYMFSVTYLFIVIWVHGRVANLQNETKKHNNENKINLRKNHEEKMYQNKIWKQKEKITFTLWM
jgi:hypothetical protein